jgi:hypothetical protein
MTVARLQVNALLDGNGADIVYTDKVGVVVDAKLGRIALANQVGFFDTAVCPYPLLEAFLAWLAAVSGG